MRDSSSKSFPKALLVLSIIIAFFLPPLLKGKIPIPADTLLGLYHPFRDESYSGYNSEKFPVKNPLITDPILQQYPWKKIVTDNYKRLNLPLWNPYNFSGQPLAANIQSAPFSIFNLLFLGLPFNLAWSIQTIGASIFLGLFTFLFLKEIGLSSKSAVFASTVLPFTGFFMAWMTWSTVVLTGMWLPAILTLIEKIRKKQQWYLFLLIIVCISQTIFSGHWQISAYIFLAIFLYLLFSYKEYGYTKIKFSIIAIFLGILIALPQILPSLEFINLSFRQEDQSYFAGRQDWFIPYQNLIQFVVPDFFGNPTTYNYWGIWNYLEFIGYIGILPTYFATLALLNRSKKTAFFALLLIISFILSLKNPVSLLPYKLSIPLLASSQPSRIIFLIVFALTCLSAYGFEIFFKSNHKKKPLFTATALLIIASTILAGTIILRNYGSISYENAQISLRNSTLPLILALSIFIVIALKKLKLSNYLIICVIYLLTLFDLFRFANKFTPFSQTELIYPHNQAMSFLISQEKPFRVMSTDRRILPPNSNAFYKIESISGYDPLFLKSYASFLGVSPNSSPNRIITPENINSPSINFLNVKYVISLEEIDKDTMVKVLERGSTKIYENKKALPRAYFVDEVKKGDFNSNQTVFEKVAYSQDFEYRVLENKNFVNFTNYHDQELSLTVFTQKRAPLVLSNIYYPGWHASIDDKHVEIQKVNIAFQMIMVPEGSHEIKFTYKPSLFVAGVIISLIAALASIGFAYSLWKKKYL